MSNDKIITILWNKGIFGLIIGVILVLLLGKVLVDNKMNLANAISICASAVAILSLLFAQYRNENNIKKQLSKADERLEIQMDKANIRLEKQLDAQKENLREQLIHEDKQKVLLNMYSKLSSHHSSKKSLNYNPFKDSLYNSMLSFASDGDMIKNEEISIFIDKFYIYIYLKEIRSDIFSYYYVPDDIKKLITNYINKIENKSLEILKINAMIMKILSNL